MRCLAVLALSSLAACAGVTDDDSVVGGASGLDVSVSVADTSWLPTDRTATFEGYVRPASGADDATALQVALGETARIELPAGEWDVFASFAWQDPSKADTDTQDTGGYIETECSGSMTATVVGDQFASANILAQCADEHLD